MNAPWRGLAASHASDPGWYSGRRVTVMGLGQWGGGLGVVQWMLRQGAVVCLTDMAKEEQLAASLRPLSDAIASNALRLRLGSHAVEDFTGAQLVVANAAVAKPWENQFLRAAGAASVPVTTEIRLAIENLATDRTVGITGSAGKSTTTAMTARALEASGRKVRVGGNFGGSLLGAERVSGDEWVVLELSSAQLWWLSAEGGGDGWSPAVAALTNIAPNHLDWHGSLAHYAWSKGQIRRCQGNNSAFLSTFAVDAPAASAAAAHALGGDAWWSDAIMPSHAAPVPPTLVVPGEHQRRNARLALAILAACADHDRAPMRGAEACAALASFTGLDHRLQYIGDIQGVRCFNDSKATTPEATLLAVSSFPETARVHLIAGGYDKRIDLAPISSLASELAGLYAIGATADEVGKHPNAIKCGTLETAVERALFRATPGDVLLLSPGCASWDQFTNFEERGRRFAELLRARA